MLGYVQFVGKKVLEQVSFQEVPSKVVQSTFELLEIYKILVAMSMFCILGQVRIIYVRKMVSGQF